MTPVADGFLDILGANVISDLTLCLTIGLEPTSYNSGANLKARGCASQGVEWTLACFKGL